MRSRLIIVIILVTLLFSTTTLASDISDADYMTTIQIVNTSASVEENNAVVFTMSTEAMIDAGMLNATATDAAMLDGSGEDVAFQPSVNATYPWCTFVDSIGGSSTQYHYLYSGSVTGGKYRYFPGTGGMAVLDNATLEPGSDNFTIHLSGLIDTTAGAGKYIWWHGGTIQCYVDASTSGKINVVVGGYTLSAINVDTDEHEIIISLEDQ